MQDSGLIDSWDAALDDVMQVAGAEVSALFVEDRSRSPTTFDVISLRGYPENVPEAYTSYFVGRDVRMPALAGLPPGQLYADDHTMPFAQIEHSEIYNDFYRPIGVAHGMAAVPFHDEKRFGIFSAHRAIRAGNFRPDDVTFFERLSPHLTRALQVRRQVARAEAVASGLAVALDHFQMAVLLADEQGDVIEVNLAAEALLRRPECSFRLVSKRLSATSLGASAALARAIAAAAWTSIGRIGAVPPVLRLGEDRRQRRAWCDGDAGATGRDAWNGRRAARSHLHLGPWASRSHCS